MNDILFEMGDKDALPFIDLDDIISHLQSLGFSVNEDLQKREPINKSSSI